jgi:hypothetical protein
MNDWDSWAKQRRALALQSDAITFLESVKNELESYDNESQSEALLALASALKADLLAGRVPLLSANASQQILDLLGLAEDKLRDDPLPSMMLTSHLVYDCHEPARAYPYAVRAVEKARHAQDMVRQCTGDLIRLCIALEKFDEIEPLLAFLTEYQPSPTSCEIALESDFLGRIPAGSVSPAVLRSYRERLGLE